MPSSATITSFYNFSANTKARASQVNNNFDVFRGHIIPVDPNTATSIDNTYDLGALQYYWRHIYCQDLNLKSNTTSGYDLKIIGITATESSNPGFKFMVGSQEYLRIGGSLTASTLTAGIGQAAISSILNPGRIPTAGAGFTATSISQDISGSTITISTIGRPVLIELVADTSSSITLYGNNSANINYGAQLRIKRNGTVIRSIQAQYYNFTATFTSQDLFGDICFTDIVAKGTYNYSLELVAFANSQINLQNKYLKAFELI